MNKIMSLMDIEKLFNNFIEFLPSLFVAIGLLFLFWLFFKITQRSLHKLLGRAGLDATLIRLLVDNVYRVVVLLFGSIMAADQVGVNVGAALAGLGVAGIAVGFAAQDTIANIIAGFLIFLDQPFQVGDWVTVAEKYGCVTDITMRTTRIRTNNNTYAVIPNKNIIDQVLVNHSKHGKTRIDVPVGIAYKENIPQARKVILEAIAASTRIEKDPAPDVVVETLNSSSVDLKVRVWIDNAADEQPVYYETIERSKLALDAAGIEIPYHHLQLFIDNVDDSVWSGAAAKLSALAGGRG